jgi:tetratricopeptide (TPR) repeat protein
MAVKKKIFAGALIVVLVLTAAGIFIYRQGRDVEKQTGDRGHSGAQSSGKAQQVVRIETGTDVNDTKELIHRIHRYRRLFDGDRGPMYNGRVHLALGELFYQVPLIDSAIHHFREVRQLTPGEYKSLYYLGVLYGKKGELSSKIVAWKEFLEMAPNHPMAAQVKEFLADSIKRP